jgi:uncharacterized membrane protein
MIWLWCKNVICVERRIEMERLQGFLMKIRLPVLGIAAFSGCSINALANMLLSMAKHPTPFLWFAAGLVELMTAWLVYQVVEQVRTVTKSNISKQDRRFYAIILIAFAVLAVPSLALSVVANALEFGNVLLGFVFPLLSVGCAIGAALPETVAKFEQKKAEGKAEADRKRADRRRENAEKAQKEAVAAQIKAERAQRLAEEAQREAQKLTEIGQTTRQIYDLLVAEPGRSQADIAQKLGITRQTASYHIGRLEAIGLIGQNGKE